VNIYIIVLRLIHIFSGVFWAGTTFLLASSVKPAIKATGPEAGKFMQKLTGSPGRLTDYLGITATLSALSGLLLYWSVSAHFNPGFFLSGRGLVLTLGALAGLFAWLHGAFVVRKLSKRMEALGKEIQEAGGPPTPEQMAEIGGIQEKQFTNGAVLAILLAIAVTGMSVAEYVFF
jgi:uncharacterized membrane protein